MNRRLARVNNLLREEISQLISGKIKDPRLPALVSITQVITSPDLQHAKVYVSVLGGPEDRENAIKSLTSASSFMSRELRHSLATKYTPQLHFFLDDSIEKGSQLLELINSVTSEPPS